MTTDINGGTQGPFNTQIPTLAENADIQKALRIYHYGSDTTNPDPLVDESIAGHLNTLKTTKMPIPVLITGSSTNLNDYVVNGYYHQASTSDARTGTNYPTSPTDSLQHSGMLEVLVESGIVYQTYTMSDNINIKFWRIKLSGTWSSWKTATDQVTGSASTIITQNVAANRALISGAGQKVEASVITSSELGTLQGAITSTTIQAQLNRKSTVYDASGQLAGHKTFIQQAEPTGAIAGDLWFW